jgi:hypothetical protein
VHRLTHHPATVANQTVTPRRTTALPSVCFQHRREWLRACTCGRDGHEQRKIRQSWDGGPGCRPDPDLHAGVGGAAVGGEGIAESARSVGQSTGKLLRHARVIHFQLPQFLSCPEPLRATPVLRGLVF